MFVLRIHLKFISVISHIKEVLQIYSFKEILYHMNDFPHMKKPDYNFGFDHSYPVRFV